MRPDKKKAGDGQATDNNGHSLGKNNGHCSQLQYKGGYRDSQPFNLDTFSRKIQRAMGDCYVSLEGWPAIRYNYFITSNGKLITRGERRAGA
jgi:hypothetical protein